MLEFDIDDRRLAAIAKEFAASPKQIDMAYNRALKRTAGTLRRLATAGLKSELGLRNTKALRRRIKEYRVGGRRGKGIKLWFGANDLPISAFKGRPHKTGGGIKFGDIMIHGAFFAKRGGRRGVYRRVGKAAYPIEEVMMPVSDRIMTYLEDNVFVDLDTIFFKHFAADIRARTIYGVGR
jgi:hypothetical protein